MAVKREHKDSLRAGAWFNESSAWLKFSAIAVALAFIAGSVSIAYYVAQYFVCIGTCQPGTPPWTLVLISTFFGLIPAVGTGAMGYFIVRGLWQDARQTAAEQEDEPDRVPAAHATGAAKS